MTVLVTVKAYPTVSDRHGEAVCVAGIRTDTEPATWVRLFPLAFRDLPPEQRFAKWQFIELDAIRGSDTRPESFKPILDTIRPGAQVDTKNNWALRCWYLDQFLMPNHCGPGGVLERQRADRSSLAVIQPREVLGFDVEPAPGWSLSQRAIIGQGRLDDLERSRESLEELPYKFRYHYRCRAPACKGNHHHSILDWEIGQSFRSWRDRYGGEQAALVKIREKWRDEVAGPGKDTYFLLGNAHVHPGSFMVIGVAWPPRGPRQPPLFA
jgi:hypothetical protein